jgi:hypothetical protein
VIIATVRLSATAYVASDGTIVMMAIVSDAYVQAQAASINGDSTIVFEW